MNPRKAPFVEIPDWAIGERKDFADLIAAIALAGFEGQWIRLSSATQRKLIGKPLFGKRALRCSASQVDVFRTTCFGADVDHQILNNQTWPEAIKAGWLS